MFQKNSCLAKTIDNGPRKDFFEKVYEIVRKIPPGKVTTYGAIAKSIGIKSAAQMVGWALNSLAFEMGDVPAHRVVNRRGELTGWRYFPTPTFMRELLESEGVGFVGERVDMLEHYWDPNVKIE